MYVRACLWTQMEVSFYWKAQVLNSDFGLDSTCLYLKHHLIRPLLK